MHYPVEIWLWPSPEGKDGQLAPIPRRYSTGCLKYRQCVLEECESDIQYTHTIILSAGPVWRSITHVLSILSTRCLQTRIRPLWCCRQMHDSSVKTTSFHLHSILPPTSFFHRTIVGGDICGSASRVDQAMNVLQTDHSALKASNGTRR
ncbi:hypothetical protein TNCV_3850351 [Trichonephila clavipes]|nr:hypothetical protein TNCV_3850351 [Trichonephila clavipes]